MVCIEEAHHDEELSHFHLLLVRGGALAAPRVPPPLHDGEHDDGVAPAGVCIQVRECDLPAPPRHYLARVRAPTNRINLHSSREGLDTLVAAPRPDDIAYTLYKMIILWNPEPASGLQRLIPWPTL